MSDAAPSLEEQASSGLSCPLPGSQFLKKLHLPSTLCTRSNSIQSLIAVKDGEYLWACCNEGTIIVWETKTGRVIGSRQAHKATIFDMICVSNAHNPFAKQDFTVWTACMDSTVTLWNPSLCVVKKLNLGASSATCLIQVSNHVYIADAKQIFIFDSQTYALVKAIDLPHIQYLTNTEPTIPTSNTYTTQDDASQTLNSNFHFNRSAMGTIMARAKPADLPTESFSGYFVRCMALVGTYVWVCTDGFVCFLDTQTLTIVPGTLISVPKVNSIVYLKSLNQVWGGCSDSSIYIWDADAPSISKKDSPSTGIEPIKRLSGWCNDRVSRLANFEDRYVFSGSWDKILRIWDAKEAKIIHVATNPCQFPIMAIVLLPYPWLRILPSKTQAAKQSSKSTTSSTEIQALATPDAESIRRSSQSLPATASPSLSSPTSHISTAPPTLSTSAASIPKETQSNFETPNTVTPPLPAVETGKEVEFASIMAVYTADWSSVSMWV